MSRVTRMARLARWSAVVGVLAAVVLTGCDSGGDDPVVSPTPTVSSTSASPSTSPSPSPTPSSTGPDIPAAARAQTPAGAEAFARFYIAESGLAWMKADPGLLEGLSTPNCKTCVNLSQTASKLNASGHRYAEIPIRVDATKRLNATATRVVVEMTLSQLAADVVDASGKVVDSQSSETLTRAARVVWQEGQWRIDGISE